MADDDTRGASSSSNNSLSWFTSMQSLWNDSMDEQRIERLQQCRALEDVLTECRRKAKKKNQDRVHLEDIPGGIRMIRYFDWRNVHDYDSKCTREIHAVWACRGIALQCGSELVELRSCFHAVQAPVDNDPNVKNYGAVLDCSQTAYENKNIKMSKEIPCRSFQERIGRCIATNAKALIEREAARSDEVKRTGAKSSE